MSDRIYGVEEKLKLSKLVNEGITVLSEIETLREGLSESVRAIADELDIKPALINKVIKIVHKGEWDRYNSDFEELEAIYEITKKD